MYDSYMTSFIMTHILWVIKSRFFQFPRFFGDFTLLESEKRANKYKFTFRYYDSLYESYIYEWYLVLKQTVWSIIKLKKNWRLTTWWGWRADREKYMKSLCSATTWMFFFHFLLGIGIIMVDSHMTSFVMTYTSWVIKSHFFNFLGPIISF